MVGITNTGSINSEFTLNFICSEGILPLQFESFFINQNESLIIEKEIYVEYDQERNYTCEV